MTSIKDKTAEALMDYWKANRNLARFLAVAKHMLVSSNSRPEIRGEMCEVVLEILLREFIRKNNLKEKGWFLVRGLILNDPERPNSEYLTELDLTLFTPKLIYAFECKSYKGSKVLKDECSIYLKNKDICKKKFDVYSQHKKHFVCLHKHLHHNLINVDKDTKPYKLVLFDFSDGSLEDLREEKYKKIFPSVNPKTLTTLFSNYNSKRDNWDVKGVRREVLCLLEDKKNKTVDHLKYVTSLNHGNS